MESSEDITQLLIAWSNGDQGALDRLVPVIEAELRRLARSYLRREPTGHSLQTTALVNEAYIQLIQQERIRWQSRAHFFGIAARLMRQILVGHARKRRTAKRDGHKLPLEEARDLPVEPALDLATLVTLHDALENLEALDPRQGRIVELKYFGGLTNEETAEVLGISLATVKSDWRTAKVWLLREMS